MTFTPFDLQCFNKLQDKFEHQFEPELINDICRQGSLKSYQADTTIMDIGTDIKTGIKILNQAFRILIPSLCLTVFKKLKYP